MGGRELWRLWRDQFDDDLEALAEAIWAANKMVKTESPETRDRFYALKDEFILRYATSGRRVRDEPPALSLVSARLRHWRWARRSLGSIFLIFIFSRHNHEQSASIELIVAAATAGDEDEPRLKY